MDLSLIRVGRQACRSRNPNLAKQSGPAVDRLNLARTAKPTQFRDIFILGMGRAVQVLPSLRIPIPDGRLDEVEEIVSRHLSTWPTISTCPVAPPRRHRCYGGLRRLQTSRSVGRRAWVGYSNSSGPQRCVPCGAAYAATSYVYPPRLLSPLSLLTFECRTNTLSIPFFAKIPL
jgi:hypothetical protein